MTIREQAELRERNTLCSYATLSENSKGRKVWEEPCDLRPVFQRDRDRILHCKSFRRLKQKTQVFLSPEGDHYRTRMTHTLEVSQIGRTIARSLRLNEDLVEAIALGHDLGHTPFGHAGERALNALNPNGFEHCKQSVRVVETLEKDGRGLNLTWEVIDGIRNHQFRSEPATLEGQIVRLSDKIAYINHDIDDAIRGGIISEADIPLEFKDGLGVTQRQRLNTMIHSVINSSMDQDQIIMSDDIMDLTKGLRQFLFDHVYTNNVAKGEETKAIHMISNLYEYYMSFPEKLPSLYISMLERGEVKEQVVCDYIAGMTDTYAVKKFEEIFVPKFWKI